MKCKRIIIVLGMHRCGTSAITRGLETLGVDLGEHLMGAVPKNNDKGFWEDIDINTINDDILVKLHSSWNDINSLDISGLSETKLLREKEAAKNLLEGKLLEKKIFGFKDPRTSILLPFWKEVFAELELDASYLICVRDPLSVAKSLHKRDKIPQIISFILWQKYFINAITHTQGCKKIVVDFSLLLQNPIAQLERISNRFFLQSPNNSEEHLEAYTNNFLQKSLQHHESDISVIEKNINVPKLLYSTYNCLLKLATDEISFEGTAFAVEWKQIEVAFTDFFPLISHISESEKKHNSLVAEFHAFKTKFEHLQKEYEVMRRELREKMKEEQLLKGQVQLLEGQVQLLEGQIEIIVNSKSWYLTKPLRFVRKFLIDDLISRIHQVYSKVLRGSWRSLPLSSKRKIKIKDTVFSLYPSIFKHSQAYKNWQIFTGNIHGGETRDINQIIIEKDYFSGDLEIHDRGKRWFLERSKVNKVPQLESMQSIGKPVRLLAFYLPQFHPIPENNEWWGYGFTEWTNVKPADPQFLDHYQPHIPDELGYYDLRDVEVQQRQIELAKLYGVGGFCFYFYWFNGKRLLETPLLNFLYHKNLDFPFCLCWANENWTRRWDGLDNDILISQNYTESDDIDFISYLSKYLKDERYVKINGKPLILVYRPNLLPSAKETAKRWRRWCRNNGIGEIYLAYTQSFEMVDPVIYGFDAAIEFPPNNSSPPDLTDKIVPLSDRFAGKVYDWNVFVERSKNYRKKKYKLFRSVNPGWDNTARKKGNGTIFINSSPIGYQKWLYNAINDTINKNDTLDERIVFVNAWNEWAEGAHLEPDQKFGFAYLEASRMALVRAGINCSVPESTLAEYQEEHIEGGTIAIVVHSYYFDVFEEIVGYLLNIKSDFKLFVTAPENIVKKVKGNLQATNISYEVVEVENRGRDILPFLYILNAVKAQGFSNVLKIHTKKSEHRQDGELWRKDIFEKFLRTDNLSTMKSYLDKHPDIGMIGPSGHVVPMNTYLGANLEKILELAKRMGIDERQALNLPFVAGSMFFCRLKALEPILSLALPNTCFETEEGQVDGTLAHSIERAFSISVCSAGMRLVGTKSIIDGELAESDITENYRFAKKTVQ